MTTADVFHHWEPFIYDCGRIVEDADICVKHKLVKNQSEAFEDVAREHEMLRTI